MELQRGFEKHQFWSNFKKKKKGILERGHAAKAEQKWTCTLPLPQGYLLFLPLIRPQKLTQEKAATAGETLFKTWLQTPDAAASPSPLVFCG